MVVILTGVLLMPLALEKGGTAPFILLGGLASAGTAVFVWRNQSD
jgi:hypothetical protein